MDDVIVVDYDPAWPGRYEAERALLVGSLGGAIAVIEHVGSTAVPGLAAKPVIDIQLGVRQMPLSHAFMKALADLGYEFRRYNEPWWAFFRKGIPRTHHLHVVNIGDEKGLEELEKTFLFRDYLCTHPEAARQYEALKRGLAARFAADRIAYGDGKTAFILSIIEKLKAWQNVRGMNE